MDIKKSPEADLEKRRNTFLLLGLVLSLAITLIAFEWKEYDSGNFSFGKLNLEDIPEEIIPITRQEEKLPPPPPAPAQQLVIVQDDVIIENEANVQESEITQETVVEVPPAKEEVIDEPEIFITAEQMPEYPGGESKLFEFLSTHIKYPGIALENGISGTVYLSFVIAADGIVKNVKVLKGIGGGCDEEAVRVVLTMPKWNPGRQRNRPVPVQYSIPVQFRLR